MRKTKALMRKTGEKDLVDRGYTVIPRSGQGLLPGARLKATKDGVSYEVAVRTSYERVVSFTRHTDGQWRTLPKVDLVIVVVPAENDSEKIEALTFSRETMTDVFDEALRALRRQKREPAYGIPIFVPLDTQNKKNFGHPVAGLKTKTMWVPSVFGDAELSALRLQNIDQNFIDRVKREFAEINNVDVSKVFVEFRIVA
jgi:hypothetical protein